ncbi:MAG TPA: TetR/AcrR family transcriptional regulator [Acidimicrobiales bacterium]|nr:TetR/AcrR family transcriptional regulator [Acidimicrobiales bacterium]
MAIRLPAPRRRRQLLDVALELFADGGFHQTSMEEIAERAGVTKPVLYQHFASKRALYLELLDDVGTQLLSTIAGATAGAGSPRHQVENGFAAYFRFVADRRSAFRLLFGDGPRRDPEFASAVRRVEDSIAAVIADLIEADLEPEHRRQLAHGIVGLAEGTSQHWLARGADPATAPEVLARRTAELAWAGLRGIRADR